MRMTARKNNYAMKFCLYAVAILSALNGIGCATINADAPVAFEAPSDLPDAARLDVALIEFDPGLPPDGEDIPDDIYPEVREAEAKLLPIQLKNTLEETGQWGTVSILPVEPIGSDVTLTATILHSDGRNLWILVHVKDASGRVWFERKYQTEAYPGSYGSAYRALDPHQPMYNTIANAMVEARSKLNAKQLEEISTISELQFASRLSPEAFDGYLIEDEDGEVEIVRLPARDEPMLERVAEVRLRDEMFVDTMGIHYQNYAAKLEPNYWHWREASSQEILAKEALRREQIIRGVGSLLTLAAVVTSAVNVCDKRDKRCNQASLGAMLGGAMIIQHQIEMIKSLDQQRQMHQEGLDELADSFRAEVQPVVVDLNSTSVRLTGTATAQYEEWQRLLHDVYEAENAVIADIYMMPRQPTKEDWIGDNTLPMVNSQ